MPLLGAGAVSAAGFAAGSGRWEPDDSPRQREQMRGGARSWQRSAPSSPERALLRQRGAAGGGTLRRIGITRQVSSPGGGTLRRIGITRQSSSPEVPLPRSSRAATGQLPGGQAAAASSAARADPASAQIPGSSLAAARQAVMTDLATNPPPGPLTGPPQAPHARGSAARLPEPWAEHAGRGVQRFTTGSVTHDSGASAMAALRRDSPMDPLLEARRVVLHDLAERPGPSSGYSRSGGPGAQAGGSGPSRSGGASHSLADPSRCPARSPARRSREAAAAGPSTVRTS